MQTNSETPNTDLTESFLRARRAVIDVWTAATAAEYPIEVRDTLINAFLQVTEAQDLASKTLKLTDRTVTETDIRAFNRQVAKAGDLDALMPLCVAFLRDAGIHLPTPPAHECAESDRGRCAFSPECEFMAFWNEVSEQMQAFVPENHYFGPAGWNWEYGFWSVED
jgi:hypothetical protein